MQDTLFLMGMMEEFESGRQWIEEKFDMNKMSGDVSVFETNIRYLVSKDAIQWINFMAIFVTTE